MLKFLTDGQKLKALIKGSHGAMITFEAHIGNDYLTHLVRQDLFDKFYALIQSIREEAYNKGWKDAKAKVSKESQFSGWVD